MPGSSKCCLGGGVTFGCLVIVGVYAVLISISFAIVTALYLTNTGGCDNIEADTVKVMDITHVDVLNQDNSVNGATVMEPVDGEEEDDGKEAQAHSHRVYCDCGTQAVLTFFEIIVLVAAITGMIFMVSMCLGFVRGTFLNHRQKQINLKKEKDEKLQRDREEAVLKKIAMGELTVPKQPMSGSAIEVPS